MTEAATDRLPTVHLVGAGPGDPLLLTRRAADLLASADVVVADRRSTDPVVALAPASARRVFVGRTDGQPAWEVDTIADLLATEARTGARVVRLKSGDPFICSRGAEEADALAARGIACEVTPGVSAATAAPLAARWPVGDRAVVASGDRHPDQVPVPWAELADPAATLVVLTGRAHQGVIADALIGAGLPASTPAAVVSAAGRPRQQIATTTLAGLGVTRLPAPAAFLVGPSGSSGAHP